MAKSQSYFKLALRMVRRIASGCSTANFEASVTTHAKSERPMPLVVQDGLIRANTYIQIAKHSGLTEKLHMTAVQQIVATTNENLLFF